MLVLVCGVQISLAPDAGNYNSVCTVCARHVVSHTTPPTDNGKVFNYTVRYGLCTRTFSSSLTNEEFILVFSFSLPVSVIPMLAGLNSGSANHHIQLQI